MDHHNQLSDTEFQLKFEAGSLPPALFSHEAHIRLAWLQIREYGLESAIERVCKQLINYVTMVGATDKYHATLTVAALKIVNHFLQKSRSDNFSGFIREFPVLISNFKGLLAAHYSIDIFNSPRAKKEYMEPDIPFE